MKFVLLMVSAAVAGALTMLALPTTMVGPGVAELRQMRLADLKPLQLIFDYQQKRIRTPLTPEEMGFHGSPVVLTPIAPPPALKLDLGQSLDPQAQYELQHNNQRMQDMQAYMRDPSHWVGPPPN